MVEGSAACVSVLRAIDIKVSVPLCEDFMHFAVNTSEGNQKIECKNFKAEVPCVLEFCSTKSVSKSDFITIVERNSGMK